MSLDNLQLDKQKKLLIVIFCALIVYVDTAYILKAQLAGLNNLKPKLTRLENDLRNLNRNLDNMRTAQGKHDLAAGKPVSKSTKIISEGQISGLLQDISDEANKLGIKIIQIRPSREIQSTKSAIISDKLIPILINLDLICDYHALGKLINKIENSAVYMGVHEFKASTQVSNYLKQKVTLVIKTYVVK